MRILSLILLSLMVPGLLLAEEIVPGELISIPRKEGEKVVLDGILCPNSKITFERIKTEVDFESLRKLRAVELQKEGALSLLTKEDHGFSAFSKKEGADKQSILSYYTFYLKKSEKFFDILRVDVQLTNEETVAEFSERRLPVLKEHLAALVNAFLLGSATGKRYNHTFDIEGQSAFASFKKPDGFVKSQPVSDHVIFTPLVKKTAPVRQDSPEFYQTKGPIDPLSRVKPSFVLTVRKTTGGMEGYRNVFFKYSRSVNQTKQAGLNKSNGQEEGQVVVLEDAPNGKVWDLIKLERSPILYKEPPSTRHYYMLECYRYIECSGERLACLCFRQRVEVPNVDTDAERKLDTFRKEDFSEQIRDAKKTLTGFFACSLEKIKTN